MAIIYTKALNPCKKAFGLLYYLYTHVWARPTACGQLWVRLQLLNVFCIFNP